MNKKYSLITLALMGLSLTFTGCKDSKDAGQSSSQATEGENIENADYQPASAEDQKIVDDQKKMIEEFYANYVFGDKPYKADILHKYCTDKLIDKLKKDYDLEDGGGYAIWDFRTDAQDGDGESKINDITPVAENCLEVHFTDMGNEGSHKIFFANEGNGEWRMDKIE